MAADPWRPTTPHTPPPPEHDRTGFLLILFTSCVLTFTAGLLVNPQEDGKQMARADQAETEARCLRAELADTQLALDTLRRRHAELETMVRIPRPERLRLVAEGE